MSLPPIFYHHFRRPLPYASTLALQDKLVDLALARRKSISILQRELLLLLEHRPVYTMGRRQVGDQTKMFAEEERLRLTGPDFCLTKRGGQLTFHGPGQLVGYPLLDLGRRGGPPIAIRDYICALQTTLRRHLADVHGIESFPHAETGVFLSERTKIASIGVQVRHRLVMHGFSLNVTREPLPWFEQIVACGLPDVKAVCLADHSKTKRPEELTVAGEIPALVETFGHTLARDMRPFNPADDPEVAELIQAVEEEAEKAGPWDTEPRMPPKPPAVPTPPKPKRVRPRHSLDSDSDSGLDA